MATQRNKKTIINYPPSTLKTFEVLPYQWIDNLCFTIDPKDCLDNAEEYIKIVNEMLLEEGWDGDGQIELMWIPPFMFKEVDTDDFTSGVTVWHVKQLEDGFSWILHPKNIFDNLQEKSYFH
jgi:hypothetical protein